MTVRAPVMLSVQGLCAGYGHAQALFGIDFELRQGEVVTLLGRNGMGRSTTVKCLFGLLPVWSGALNFAGHSLTDLPSHKIAQLGLGLVPEGRQVFPNLTVEENLVATARPAPSDSPLRPWTLSRIYEFFPRLKERQSNPGSQLSGGEQQLLAIGRALMTNPVLLVLDEATEGLAPLIREEIWQTLSALKAEGLSQIVIDKNIKPLLKFADHHFILEKGRVVWNGNSEELGRSPEVIHQYLGV